MRVARGEVVNTPDGALCPRCNRVYGCECRPPLMTTDASGAVALTDAGVEALLRPLREDPRDVTAMMRAEIERLRSIIEGRTEPPTDAELATHQAAHPTGGWMVSRPDDDTSEGAPPGLPWASMVRMQREGGLRWRWIPLDGRGCPCDWPVTP